MNSRVRWIIEPGKDLYLVFNENWVETASHAVIPESAVFVVKLTLTFRF